MAYLGLFYTSVECGHYKSENCSWIEKFKKLILKNNAVNKVNS